MELLTSARFRISQEKLDYETTSNYDKEAGKMGKY